MTARNPDGPAGQSKVGLIFKWIGRGLLVFVGIVVLTVVIFVVWFFRLLDPSYDWHQKLTVTVQTPQKEVSASSVVEVESYPTGSLERNYYLERLRGEAVVLRLPSLQEGGKPRYLFALLGERSTMRRFYYAYDEGLYGEKKSGRWASVVDDYLGQQITLPQKLYPMMVTFEDINDPASVKRVDPNDMDAALGCDRPSSEEKPWRKEGITWAHWYRRTMKLKAMKETGADLGFPPSAADAIFHVFAHNWLLDAYPELRPEYVLTSGQRENHLQKYRDAPWGKPGDGQWDKWVDEASKRLNQLDGPIRRDTSSDCYQLKSIAFEITDEPVTTDRVESVLGWLPTAEFIIPFKSRSAFKAKGNMKAELSLRPSHFIDGTTLKKYREGTK